MTAAGWTLLTTSTLLFGAGGFAVRMPGAANHERFAQAQVFGGFGCAGANRSPAIAWSEPPAGTMSFAITIFDPDAPTGHGWMHWTVFDLPAALRELPEGAGDAAHGRLPSGAIQARNDFGAFGYGGPCPPAGDHPHRYLITVWALDIASLGLDARSSADDIAASLRRHALGQAAVTLRYGR